jgi:hypothetical protein
MTDATPAGWRRPSHVQQPLTADEMRALIREAIAEADKAAQELAVHAEWLTAVGEWLTAEARAERDEARERWTDLQERLTRAQQELSDLIWRTTDTGVPNREHRLEHHGKRQGVSLALSYMDDTGRGVSQC